MEQIGGEQTGQRTSLRRAISASIVGTTLEWYDFFLYGTAAAVVFGPLFFPQVDPLVGTLAVFGTFAIAFAARPFGAIIFGNIGDKVGRKTALILTLLLMGVATGLMGLLPTYETIGIWAPILLVALRMVQGLGVGGELGGAILMATEYSPPDKRGFYASFPCTGVSLGIVLSSGAFALVSLLPEEQFLSWGWRVPFLLSFIVVLVGLYLRLRIRETPAFTRAKESGTEVRWPVLEVVRTQPKALLVAMGTRVAEAGNNYLVYTFALTYIVQVLALPASTGLTGVLIASGFGVLSLPAFGALSDRVGRKPVIVAASAFIALFAFPFFWLLNTESPVLIWLAMTLGLAGGGWAMLAMQAVYFSELFGVRQRYSGISIAREVAGAVVGGTAPFVGTALFLATDSYWPVATYLAVLGLIGLVAISLGPETHERAGLQKGAAREGAA